jgi:hypothetical protein
MIGSVVWAGSSVFTHDPIFWPEVVALWAFAMSWLVKGEVYNPILQRLLTAREFIRQADPPVP